MKTLKYNLRLLISLIVFSLPWGTAQAVEDFEKNGIINSVGYDQFTIYHDEKKYRFAPGAKISSKDDKRLKFSDFKPGDHIYFEGVQLNGVFYVNIIYHQKPVPM